MMRADICRNAAAWDAYIKTAPAATNYHRWVWKSAIENTWGHQASYLSASEGGEIRGVLPLFSIESRLLGRSLVSLPFFSFGGLIADSPEARNALLDGATALAREKNARHIELRQNLPGELPWESTVGKVRMTVRLPDSVDAMWKRISTGLRNKIRKAQKSDLRIEWGGAESIPAFYDVFASNMRNLGTPVYPRRWFEELHRADPANVRLLNLWSGDRAVAGAFLVAYGDTLELPWSASLPDFRKQYSHVLLYWTFLEWAIQNGFRTMDLGRCTPGGGTWEFKKHWICEETPMHWYYWLKPGVMVPSPGAANKRFRLAVEIWKHLPLAVTNRLGPHIVRTLP